jgi:O-antigen/teichoic acid export membrane protein
MTFQTALYPRVIHARDDFEVTIRSLRLCFYGWGGIILLMILLAEPILFVYGGKSFLQAVPPFRILMIAAWFLPLASLTAPYCVKAGAFYAMTATAVILGVISVGLNLLFIPKLSAAGAALATASTCILGFFVSLFLLGYLRKESPLQFLRLRIFG